MKYAQRILPDVGQSKSKRNCDRASGRVTIVRGLRESQWEQRKWYPCWAQERAGCMPSEERGGEKLYICLGKGQVGITGTTGSRSNQGRWRSKLLQKQPRMTRCVFAQSPYSYLGSVHRSNHLENHSTINLWSRPPVFLQGGDEMFPSPA